MKKAAILLALFWVLVLVPGLLLGTLWSGSIPLWPPVVSGSRADTVIWAVLFGLAYGLPLLVILLLMAARFRKNDKFE